MHVGRAQATPYTHLGGTTWVVDYNTCGSWCSCDVPGAHTHTHPPSSPSFLSILFILLFIEYINLYPEIFVRIFVNIKNKQKGNLKEMWQMHQQGSTPPPSRPSRTDTPTDLLDVRAVGVRHCGGGLHGLLLLQLLLRVRERRQLLLEVRPALAQALKHRRQLRQAGLLLRLLVLLLVAATRRGRLLLAASGAARLLLLLLLLLGLGLQLHLEERLLRLHLGLLLPLRGKGGDGVSAEGLRQGRRRVGGLEELRGRLAGDGRGAGRRGLGLGAVDDRGHDRRHVGDVGEAVRGGEQVWGAAGGEAGRAARVSGGVRRCLPQGRTV